jgi:hypothetical protein
MPVEIEYSNLRSGLQVTAYKFYTYIYGTVAPLKKSCVYLFLVLFSGFSAAVIASGSSLEKQTRKQLESLESRAAAGNEKAQMKLAIMYLEGSGVSADTDKALFYYRLAAERDIAFAQHRLARLYLDNDHVKPDPAKALTWLLRAAKLGLVQAQLDLSQLYEDGTGINRDFVKAHKWLSPNWPRQSCFRGFAYSPPTRTASSVDIPRHSTA